MTSGPAPLAVCNCTLLKYSLNVPMVSKLMAMSGCCAMKALKIGTV